MRTLILLFLYGMLLVVNSCRCADPPPVGPVDDARAGIERSEPENDRA